MNKRVTQSPPAGVKPESHVMCHVYGCCRPTGTGARQHAIELIQWAHYYCLHRSAAYCCSQQFVYCTTLTHTARLNSKDTVIGRIHRAIVAATGRSNRRGDSRGDDCRDDRRDSRLVYTLQAIVAATIAPTVAATIAPCIRPISGVTTV